MFLFILEPTSEPGKFTVSKAQVIIQIPDARTPEEAWDFVLEKYPGKNGMLCQVIPRPEKSEAEPDLGFGWSKSSIAWKD